MFTGSLWWTFNELNTTGDDKYANQDVNSTAFNAYPGLAIRNDYGVSNYSIQTRLNGSDDCLNFGDFSGHCVSEPSLCSDGLTVSLWIRLTEDEVKEPGPVYILSSGKKTFKFSNITGNESQSLATKTCIVYKYPIFTKWVCTLSFLGRFT